METEVIKEIVTGLSFWEQAGATVIGVVAGFLFSLALFWIKENISYKKKKENILKGLRFEFDYNLNIFKKYLEQVEECISAIGANSKKTYLKLNYELIFIYFAKQFYQEGLIIKYLPVEGVKRWNDFLGNCSVGSDEYIDNELEKWRKSKIDQEDIFKSLKLEKNHLKDAIVMIEYLKGAIPAK